MRTFLFRLWQWTWGLPQTLIGAVAYLCTIGCKRERYHGAIVTHWNRYDSLGMGMFLFLGKQADRQVLVHEYGHSVQSLILGPLFLPIMGIPSFLWAGLPCCRKLRRRKKISYYTFYPESNANRLGRLATKEPCDPK